MNRFFAFCFFVGVSAICFGEDRLPRPNYERQASDPDWLVQAVQMHGHLGPSVVAGARMGMIGLRAVGAEGYFDVEVRCEGPLVKPPESCFLDGIQVGTGATLGKRSLEWVEAEKIVVRVKNTKTGKTVEVRPRAALLKMLFPGKSKEKADAADGDMRHIHEHLEAVARKIAVMPEEELVEVKEVAK